jgi:hypothetical protein
MYISSHSVIISATNHAAEHIRPAFIGFNWRLSESIVGSASWKTENDSDAFSAFPHLPVLFRIRRLHECFTQFSQWPSSIPEILARSCQSRANPMHHPSRLISRCGRGSVPTKIPAAIHPPPTHPPTSLRSSTAPLARRSQELPRGLDAFLNHFNDSHVLLIKFSLLMMQD